MQTILTVLQLFLSLGLIGLVLIQHGRGADAGAAFGSGASSTVFGSRGSGSFLSRTTAVLATLFFLTSMALAYYAAQGGKPAGLMDGAEPIQLEGALPAGAPAVPAQLPSEVPAVPPPSGAVPAEADQGTEVPEIPVDAVPLVTEQGTSQESAGDVPAPAAVEPPQSQ
jgi:preprotein translocase subunit SecG